MLDAIRRCAGAVVILHDRGVVIGTDGEWGHRSSVWVNQELAILAYRQFFESQRIPLLAFIDSKVKIEGAMTSLIVNPRPLDTAKEIAASVESWLTSGEFAATSDEVFARKWNQLSDVGRKVLASLLEVGGHNVKETVVRRAVMQRFNMQSNPATEAVHKARLEFITTDFVKLFHDIHSGDELSVHPTWEFQLRRQIAKWLVAGG